jgi:hypothetical protein
LFKKERKITIDCVKQEIAKRNEVVSSALGEQVESVLTGEDDVSFESSLFLHWDMLAVRIIVLLSKPKINDSNVMKRLCVILMFFCITDHDVVKLEIVVEEARIMD